MCIIFQGRNVVQQEYMLIMYNILFMHSPSKSFVSVEFCTCSQNTRPKNARFRYQVIMHSAFTSARWKISELRYGFDMDVCDMYQADSNHHGIESRTTVTFLNQKPTNKNKYTNNGIYQLQCPLCNKTYAGQTGRSLYQRYKEHFRNFKPGNFISNFAKHLLDNNHIMGPTESS